MAATRAPGFVGRSAEREVLDRLLETVRGGQSAVLVISGEAGIGKTAMLRYAVEHASGFRVARIVGVEAEMELPFAGVHQLCAPLLARLDALPRPQRDALSVAMGLSSGSAPELFLIGLAVLSLLAAAGEEQPLLGLVDDAQWLDAASAQVLGFVARRLLAESVAIVLAAREPAHRREWEGLPQLRLGGLAEEDARALLTAGVTGRIDDRVRDRIVAETRGNPLALLELPRRMSAAELAGGFRLLAATDLSGHIEDRYLHHVGELPEATQQLLLLAAADPVGDAALVWRAAETLGIGTTALAPAHHAGLLEIGARVRFRHPLVRSAVYRAASPQELRAVHVALADATDAEEDPDRRAWHLAAAAVGPDDQVALELERSAGRAQARGGLAAAAAFLERASTLTVDPSGRVERALDAAEMKYAAGSLDDALGLLATAEVGALDDPQRARVLLLRAQIAFASRRSSDSSPLLLKAAQDLQALDVSLARATYLEALHAAMHAARRSPRRVVEVSHAVLNGPRPPEPRHPRELILDGLAIRFTQGYAAGAPVLKEALAAFGREPSLPPQDTRWLRLAGRVALDLWDFDSLMLLARRGLERARETGTLSAIPFALDDHAVCQAVSGELDAAASTVEEGCAVSEATGIVTHPDGTLWVAALRGREADASQLIKQTASKSAAHHDALGLAVGEYVTALLYNGLGRYDAALDAVRHAREHPHEIGAPTIAVAELIEAAARTGERELAETELERLAVTTRAGGTEWALAVEARSRALLSDGEAADELYREAIERLSGTRLRPELARARLLYGEWLRREQRRVHARTQLRTAHEAFASIGMEAFAERASRELQATGGKARKRTVETRDDLTPHERQIAQMARDGLSNPEIGGRLFLSARTVEWHLRRVFSKLGIRSRAELAYALPAAESEAVPA